MTKDQSNSRRSGRVPALRQVEVEWAAILVISGIRLWLSAARTVEGIGWSDYDDLWFIRRARSILEGRWLGDYDHLTLIKGQGYPLWIAFVSALGIPLLFAQQVLYVLSCLATTRALAPIVQSRLARVSFFALLVFNPMTYADDISTRITREGFYPALTMLVFAGVAGVLLRIDARRRDVILWSVAAGIAIAVFWHTREEGVWIVPLLVCVAIAMCTRWRRLLMVTAITASIFVLAHTAIAVANGIHYGVFVTVEFKEKSFLRAYGSLTHVRARNPLSHVPVPKEVRERVYAVSPAFAELRSFLEGQLGADWAHVSKVQNREDIGWPFMWAFREAVANAGYYERGGAAVREYYDRVSREIEAARLNGRLEARPGPSSLRPPMLPGQIRSVLETWGFGLMRLVRFTDFFVTHRFSAGDAVALRQYDITHTRLAPRETRIKKVHLTGWAVHVDGALDISIEDYSEKDVQGATVKRLPTPAVYEHFAKSWKPFEPLRHAGFDITVHAEDAYLVLSLRGRVIERIALADAAPRSTHPDVRMAVDSFEAETTKPNLRSLDTLRLRILGWIGRAYQIAFVPLFALAAVICAIRWQGNRATLALLAGLLFAVAARVMILALIHVTSFAVFTAGYQAPSHALLLVAGGLIAHEAVKSGRSSFMKR